ncbi:MAG: DUF421 domain-containing protein [Actinobacteria bacterium]|nr:DUF421 domain-containing protein [Actinomycetota bacterium]
MEEWFGASWSEIGKVVTSTLAIYASVLAGLRIAGRRTVSQMSAFDFVVTIAIGSIIGATVLSSDPTYGRAVAGLVTLLAAQQLVAILRQQVPATRRLLDFSPEHLYVDGKVQLRHNPLTAQVTETELFSKLRRHGVESLEDVKLVVLEPDGRVSVLRSNGKHELWKDVAQTR